ncbi:hypothetical protein [Hyalangium versicolor]|uniref:hypothetical protein n=1 Tax=Hyalangium versicolor TaxID=2861190 RepID=UPI001CC93D83|nr:hypothetical protein [Hyalangium versicolor]
MSASLQEENGLSINGLGTNGLGTNGLGTNGLGTNGLGTNGLGTTQFATWFNQDPGLTAMVMQYIVKCAVPAGSSRTWKNPKTKVQYTWLGELGLTPSWAGGMPATAVEQQVITSCLAAHANKFGVHVPFSIMGLDSSGSPIPIGTRELNDFPEKEACFFGNLFTQEGLFAGNDAVWSSADSSVRACGLEMSNPSGVDKCLPIHQVGRCSDFCVAESKHNYYLSCTYNGKNYRPMTTRLRHEDIYHCGDGTCQISESCGTGTTPGNCKDCGPCL